MAIIQLTSDMTEQEERAAQNTNNNFLQNFTGWCPLPACTYASATTFTIALDLSSVLAVGDRLRLVQSGATKYFYVIGVDVSGSATTVTVTGGSDYSLANAAISSPAFSKAASPAGFPDWFNWVPTASGSDSMTFTITSIIFAKFKLIGREVCFQSGLTGTTSGTASASCLVTLPLIPSPANRYSFYGWVVDNAWYGAWGYSNGNDNLQATITKSSGGTFGIGKNKSIRLNGFYPI